GFGIGQGHEGERTSVGTAASANETGKHSHGRAATATAIPSGFRANRKLLRLPASDDRRSAQRPTAARSTARNKPWNGKATMSRYATGGPHPSPAATARRRPAAT